MKVLISTDIEGVAGVYHPEQTRPGNGEYERARAWMTAEADAAVKGAFAGGATDVLVNDSHGQFRNLLADKIDSRAQLIQGKPRYLGMMAGLEEGCDAVCLVGYHSRSQGRGILAHTINSFAFARIWINGEEMGEAGLYGSLAGELNVPVIMASGDDVFLAENQSMFANAVWVQTKVAYSCNSGLSLSPQASCEAIAHAAELAVQRAASVKPLRVQGPIVCRLQTQSPALADLFCVWPELLRMDGVTVEFKASSVQSAVRMLNCFSAMSSALR